MDGQINSALCFLSVDNGGCLLSLMEDVMTQMHEKHLEAKEAKLSSLLFDPIEEIPKILYQEIDGEMIKEVTP